MTLVGELILCNVLSDAKFGSVPLLSHLRLFKIVYHEFKKVLQPGFWEMLPTCVSKDQAWAVRVCWHLCTLFGLTSSQFELHCLEPSFTYSLSTKTLTFHEKTRFKTCSHIWTTLHLVTQGSHLSCQPTENQCDQCSGLLRWRDTALTWDAWWPRRKTKKQMRSAWRPPPPPEGAILKSK